MHATEVARPFHTKGWVYEEKYDGWRILAVKEAGRVRLISASLTPTRLILDGEVTVFDQELVSRFEWLRHLNHGDLATPPMFMGSSRLGA